MPNLQLDLRRPLIIITGIFNPAIFNPSWVARHLFDIPAGETVNVAVADGIGASGLIAFLNAVGISVNQSRMELFAQAATEEGLEAVEKIALKILQVLPHSPYGALGVNSGYVDDDPGENVISLFSTREKLEEAFSVDERTQSVKLTEENGHRNIERSLSETRFSIAFNRHYDDINPGNAEGLLIGAVRREVEWSKTFCRDYFGYEEIGVQTFALPET